jgi:hypothetical protein
MTRSSEEKRKSSNPGIQISKNPSINSVGGEIDASNGGGRRWKMNRRGTIAPSRQTKARSWTKKGGGKEFKPPSNSSEQWGHPSKWPAPRQRYRSTPTGGSCKSSEGGSIDWPAKSPSSGSSSHTPVRVSDKTHRTLTDHWNRGAEVGLIMGDVKKVSHGAQQQNRVEKLQKKESISL